MDSVSNMLITLKNGGNANKEVVYVPFSKFTAAIASTLFNHGYISSHTKKKRKNGDVIEIGIRYIDGKPRINDVKRVSKLSRRMYQGVKDIRPVRQGHGSVVLSTPKGILLGKEAKKEQVGGEVLFEIW